MQTCKTCQSWEPHQTMGFCRHPKHIDTSEGTWNDVYPSDAVIYYDGEGYAASEQVGPDYGCVHHNHSPE